MTVMKMLNALTPLVAFHVLVALDILEMEPFVVSLVTDCSYDLLHQL